MLRISSAFLVALLALETTACDSAVANTERQVCGERSDPKVCTVSGIDATGATDVTQELLAFFAEVPDGAVITFPAKARYRIEGVLLLNDRNNLTFEGNGATFFATTDGASIAPPNETYAPKWPRKRAQFVFIGGSRIILRNLTIRGAHPDGGEEGTYSEELEGQHGVTFMEVDGAEIDHVTITDVYGDFVYLGGRRGEWSKNVHVHDSHFERNGRQGIAITGAENVLIENNYIGDVRRTALDVEPNGELGGTRRLTIRKNTFGAIGNHFFAGHGSVGIVDDVTIEENLLQGGRMRISSNEEGNRRRNWRIINNRSDKRVGMPIPLITLHRIDGLVVRGNAAPVTEAREMTGIRITQSCNVDVGGNDFPGSVGEYVIEAFEQCTN
jgi:hypothetical protein